MDTISIEELPTLENINIVDIRTIYDYNIGHIPGAINIPYYNLLNNYKHYLNPYSIYYFYCETGEQSKKIVDRLNSFGYHAINIDGGFQEFLRVFG